MSHEIRDMIEITMEKITEQMEKYYINSKNEDDQENDW